MDQRLSIITLTVNNLLHAKLFYEKLGWKRAKNNSEEGIVFFNLQSMVLALYPSSEAEKEIGEKFSPPLSKNGEKKNSITLAYNVGSEEEVNSTIKAVETAGGSIVVPPKKTFWGGYSAYFSDVEGYLWEVSHNPFATLDPAKTFQI